MYYVYVALQSTDWQSCHTQSIANRLSEFKTNNNKSSSLHIVFLNIIDNIEQLVQLGDFKYLLMERCKALMASEVHKIHFFSSTCIEALSKCNTILLLRCLSFIFTWSNHSILRMLISFNDKAVKLLDEFDSLLDPFCTIVSYPISNFSQDMIPSETGEYTLLAMRCNRELWQCSLQYVFNVQSFIVEKCEVTQYCLQLLAVRSNPTLVYWTIPKCVVELIMTNVLQHSEFFYLQGILEVLVYPTQSLATGDDIKIGPLAFMTEKEIKVIFAK